MGWEAASGIALTVLAVVFNLMGKVSRMIEWRKQRGLWGYDPRPYAEMDGRGRERDGAISEGAARMPGKKT